MKQLVQNLRSGQTSIVDVPVPGVTKGCLLIESRRTLISSGTEKMLVGFGRANYFQKALQQPDKVRLVIKKFQTDGVQPTLEAVFNKLNQPLPLGYCNVGVVSEVGNGVSSFYSGDRVVSNGKHAEFVLAPKNLVAKVPKNVSDNQACFTVAGAIALQGIRLARPTLGEAIAVIGLGLIGQLTVQLLKANGCRVIGFDFDSARLDLAKSFGADVVDLSRSEDPVRAAYKFSMGRGADAVLIAASTSSNDPVCQAAQMCRKGGRVILVGMAGLELSRSQFFQKELTFQVSCSYGPGRYDPSYEEGGNDYPIGFVRWTAQRNFEAVLDMMSEGRLNVDPLISHKFNLDQATNAYDLVMSGNPSLGIVIQYPAKSIELKKEPKAVWKQTEPPEVSNFERDLNIGFVGSGQFATSKLMPAFKQVGVNLAMVSSKNGISGDYAAKKFGFNENVTDGFDVIKSPNVHSVVIATRHDSHASYVLAAIRQAKDVYVEKPLCLTLNELSEICEVYRKINICKKTYRSPILMVGFNRRFAPHILKIKELLSGLSEPKSFVMHVNAGEIDADHWVQNVEIGGGRIIGEVCHFVDLLRFLAGSPINGWQKLTLDSPTNDTLSIQLSFGDGSIGTIHYFSNGSRSVAKERLEIFAQGGVLKLDNYRKLMGYDWKGFKGMRLWKQDKGQTACVAAYVEALKKTRVSPIPFSELVEISRVCIELAD